MKATLDHIGIAVTDLHAALAFYRDALGLDVSTPHDVPSRTRARDSSCRVGQSSLELLEATSDTSPIARFTARRGPGIHHLTLLVEDLQAVLDRLQARGVALIDEVPRPGRAWVHGRLHSSVGGAGRAHRAQAGGARERALTVRSLTLGSFTLTPILDGYFRLDGGAMFGVVPRVLWEKVATPDDRNRIRMAMRAWLVQGAGRTILIDAGAGGKLDAKFGATSTPSRTSHRSTPRCSPPALRSATSTWSSPRISISTTPAVSRRARKTAASGHVFPTPATACGAGSGTTRVIPTSGTGPAISPTTTCRCRRPACLDLVDEDVEVAPGIRVRRTGGHTMHHQIVEIHNGGHDRDLRGRPAAYRGAPALAVHHGLRPVSDGHTGLQAGVPRRGRGAGLSDTVRARPRDRRRATPGGEREVTGGASSLNSRTITIARRRDAAKNFRIGHQVMTRCIAPSVIAPSRL